MSEKNCWKIFLLSEFVRLIGAENNSYVANFKHNENA